MSVKEQDRLKLMAALVEGRLKQKQAGWLLKLSSRQVRRLGRRYRAEGDQGWCTAREGRRSNRKTVEAVRRKALACIRRQYLDFGPTLAAEKLLERDGLPAQSPDQWQDGFFSQLFSGIPVGIPDSARIICRRATRGGA